MTALVLRSIRRVTALSVVLVVILAGFEFSLVAIASSLSDGDGLSRIASLAPQFIQEMFGLALASFAGFVSLAYFEPLILMLVVQFVIYLATEPAGDIEAGLVDLVLARSIRRSALITRSLIVMTFGAIALPLAMTACLYVALWWLAPASAAWPLRSTVLILMWHLSAIAWCFGGAALAAASFARRRGAAQVIVGVGAVALYLSDMVGDSWRRASVLAQLSPFHRFHGAQVLSGRANSTRDFTVLITIGLIGVVVAYWQFDRRDL